MNNSSEDSRLEASTVLIIPCGDGIVKSLSPHFYFTQTSRKLFLTVVGFLKRGKILAHVDYKFYVAILFKSLAYNMVVGGKDLPRRPQSSIPRYGRVDSIAFNRACPPMTTMSPATIVMIKFMLVTRLSRLRNNGRMPNDQSLPRNRDAPKFYHVLIKSSRRCFEVVNFVATARRWHDKGKP